MAYTLDYNKVKGLFEDAIARCPYPNDVKIIDPVFTEAPISVAIVNSTEPKPIREPDPCMYLTYRKRFNPPNITIAGRQQYSMSDIWGFQNSVSPELHVKLEVSLFCDAITTELKKNEIQ